MSVPSPTVPLAAQANPSVGGAIQNHPPPLHEGQSFSNFREFKDLLADWSIKAKFVYRIRKSDTKRVIAGCANRASGCPFHVRAYYCHKRECVVIGTLKHEHTCSGAAVGAKRTPASKQSWLQRVLPSTIIVTKETTPQQIIDAVQDKFQQVIRYEAAIRAKKWALQNSTATQLVPDGIAGADDGPDGMAEEDDPTPGGLSLPSPAHQLPSFPVATPAPVHTPALPSPKLEHFPHRPVRIALLDPSMLPYSSPSPLPEPDRYPWRGPSVILRWGMIRAATLKEVLRVVRRHIPEPRFPRFLTGAINPDVIEHGVVPLNDDDDTEAWLCIASGKQLELQVVLNREEPGVGESLGERRELDVGMWMMDTSGAPNGLGTPGGDNGRKRKRVDVGSGPQGMAAPPARMTVVSAPEQPRMMTLDRLDPRIAESQGNGRTLLENLGAAEARTHLGIV